MASGLQRGRTIASILLLSLTVVGSLTAKAEPNENPSRPGQLPQTSGISGYLFFGAGYRRVKSNLLPGSSLLTVGEPVITSVNQNPGSGAGYYPVVIGELNYTLAPHRLQFFFGSQVENIVTLDYAQLLGIRWELESAGTLALAYTFSGLPPQVWEDPYLEGEPRKETDRVSSGFRLEWVNIFQSGMRLQLTRRQVDIGVESSGTSQLPPPQGTGRITDRQQELLNRNGSLTDANLYGLLPLSTNRKHLLRPQLGYEFNDREGAAISHNRYYGQLTYAYRGNPVTFALSGEYGRSHFDAANPIYDKKQDGDSLLLSSTVFYQLPTAGKHWSLVASFNYAEDNSDVPFLETHMLAVALGVEFRLHAE